MKTPTNIFISLLSTFLLSFSTFNNNNNNNNNNKNPLDDFVQCLKSHDHLNSLNPNNNNNEIYTQEQNTSTYEFILDSSIQNLRPTVQYSSLKPRVIFTPHDESQIQTAIYCSKKHGLQLRVRCGGHDYEGLSYISHTPFVILDLRNFRTISIDTNEKTAWIGAGSTLGEVYHAIAESSNTLAFAAGSCPTVGVGGHFSGGGYSMLSRKFGLSVDNIIDAKIIDVKGRILDRQGMGEDLFWAIRGGGGASFGVIVSWKVNLLPVPEKVTVFNITRTEDQNATALIHRWQHVADKIDENLNIRLFIIPVKSDEGKRLIQVSFKSMFIGGADDVIAIMNKSFPELGLQKQDCKEVTWIESILYFAYFPLEESVDVLLDRSSWDVSFAKGKSDYVTRPISVKGLEGIWEMLYQEENSELQFSLYGGRMGEISEFETPFPHRGGIIYMIHYSVMWREAAELSARISWIRKLYGYMASYVSKSPRLAYLNYRDLDLGANNVNKKTSYREACTWALRYYKKNNFDRLIRVKSKVDPENFFRNEQSIPPLAT